MKKIIFILPLLIFNTPLTFSATEEKAVNISFIYSEFFIQIFATIFLFIFIKKFAWEKIEAALEQRKNNINKNIKDAQLLNENAKKIEGEKQKELSDIFTKKNEILQETIQRAKAQENQIILDAKNRSKNILEKAQEEAIKEKETVKEDLSVELTNISIEFLKKFLFDEITEQQEQRLIKEAAKRVNNE